MEVALRERARLYISSDKVHEFLSVTDKPDNLAVSDSLSHRRGDGEETGDGQDDDDAGQPAERRDDQRGSIR